MPVYLNFHAMDVVVSVLIEPFRPTESRALFVLTLVIRGTCNNDNLKLNTG